MTEHKTHPDFMSRYIEEGRWESVRETITAHGIHQWIRDFERPVRGIEIGIKEGMNCIAFLECCDNVSFMIGIDPFAPYNDLGYHWTAEEQESILGHLRKNVTLRGLDDRFQHIRLPSNNAASQISDGSIDFVFIDGQHTCESIQQDLDMYWPKLVSDGIMAGHDWQYVGSHVQEWRLRNVVSTDLQMLPLSSWAFRKS